MPDDNSDEHPIVSMLKARRAEGWDMAAEHKDIKIFATDPSGKGIIIHFSDGTTTLFQTNSEKGGYRKRPRKVYGPYYEGWNNRAVPPFPQPLQTAKVRRFPHYAPHDCGAIRILTFLSGAQQDIPIGHQHRSQPSYASHSVAMQKAISTPPQDLRQAVSAMIHSPIRTLVPPWSWKAAACSAVVRAFAFFLTNLQSGHSAATKAMLIEAIYAVFVGGLIGAVSQQLRSAKPLWATALLICLGLPGAMTLAQLAVHHLAGTPHQGGGLILSLCFAASTAAYTWYAMRRGAMLGGTDATTVWQDLQSLPRISLDLLLLAPRRLVARLK